METIDYGTNIYTVLTVILPLVSSAVTWLVMRKKRDNDFLADLQDSINLLSKKNNELLAELVKVKTQNLKLMSNQTEMKLEIEKLRHENGELRELLENLGQKVTIKKSKNNDKKFINPSADNVPDGVPVELSGGSEHKIRQPTD